MKNTPQANLELRSRLIQSIEKLFPADAKCPDTKEIGLNLLNKAIANSWKELPISILQEYDRLCRQKNNKS